MKTVLLAISAVILVGVLLFVCLVISVRYENDRPDRINKQMSILRDRAKANPPDNKALDMLINLTHSKDSFERTAAIASLGQVGSNAEPGVDTLIEALNKNALFSGNTAATSLGEIGPSARRAIPALIKAVQEHPDEGTGWFAAESLGHIANSNDTEVVTVLNQAANSSDERMRNSANQGLTALGIKP
jgi:HEAT repeat protein